MALLLPTDTAWFNDLVAQLAHVGWGMAIVLTFAVIAIVLALRRNSDADWVIWGGVVFAIALAFLKEYFFDPWSEAAPFFVAGQYWGTGLEDFTFWMVGIAIGALIGLVGYRYAVRACACGHPTSRYAAPTHRRRAA